MRLTHLAAAIALALCPPAMAQEKKAPNINTAVTGTKGSVAQMALAHDLFALGLAQKDPLTVLTAAKLALGVEMKPVEQKKATTGTATADQPEAALAPIDAAAMMTSARTLAGEDEEIAGLIDDAELQATRSPRAVATASASTLPAGQTDSWEVPFYADSYAEIAVLGDGDANLDVLVADENGNTICFDAGWSDKIFCDVVPAWNGYFTVTVQNNGKQPNSYFLLTN